MFSNKENLTLAVSACTYEKSGCHHFGDHLSEQLNLGGKIAFARSSEFNIKAVELKVEDRKPYENLCITGCECFRSNILKSLSKTHNLSNLKNIYVITPPHILIDDPTAWIDDLKKELESLKDSALVKEDCIITVLTTGIDTKPKYSLGLPSPLPKLTDAEVKVHENCYGLIYIRDLLTIRPNMHMAIAEGQKVVTPQLFLDLYFSRVMQIAKDKSKLNPLVMIITQNDKEKRIFEIEAAKHALRVQFSMFLTHEKFSSTLKTVGEKGGVIAVAGAQTLIQAIVLNCEVMHYANRQENAEFLEQIVNSLSPALQDTAKVILGLSSDSPLLADRAQVQKVHQAIQAVFSKALAVFEQAKIKPILTEPLTQSPPTLSIVTPVLADLKISELSVPIMMKLRESSIFEKEIKEGKNEKRFRLSESDKAQIKLQQQCIEKNVKIIKNIMENYYRHYPGKLPETEEGLIKDAQDRHADRYISPKIDSALDEIATSKNIIQNITDPRAKKMEAHDKGVDGSYNYFTKRR